ncbi:MAG TPA: hypothetical protein VN895_00680 [Candidatus Acidoferrum sp.]|nr:hypothetical protein [Candidatus Acidoferrum sp.]
MSGNPGPASDEDELRLAFGRAIGFTVAAVALLLGGGVVVILVAAIFFRFMFGG